jgi:hypothetical protein
MTNKTLRDYINLVENAQRESVAEGLNEFAPNGFNGGDDDEGFSPEIAKMAQEDGFTKGVSLADGATLAQAITINHWHNQHGGMYKQYFAKGFKAGRMNKIRHGNEQYNLNLKLMKDGSIRHGEQGVAEGADEGLSKYSTERLQAYVKKVSGGGVPAFGSGAKLKRVQAELKRREQGVAEAEKKPHPKTWHDVDPKLGKAVDKMSQAEKVKKGLAHPDTLKKKGVAEDQLEETSPDAIEKIEQLVRK